jgi:hypothetical protein
MKIRPFIVTSLVALMLGLAFAATVTQHASAACYDTTTKEPIPCPPSKDKQKKPTRTEVPPTKTPAATATYTPTSTATSTATPTGKSAPALAPLAGQVPAPLKTQPNACDPRLWTGSTALGLALALSGVLARARRAGMGAQATPDKINVLNYGAESRANPDHLDVNVGYVDFSGGADASPNPYGPITLMMVGSILALGSGAGVLNLIPCSAGPAILGTGALAGLGAVAVNLLSGAGGMRRYMQGRLRVTGDEKLARKMKDGFDEQK